MEKENVEKGTIKPTYDADIPLTEDEVLEKAKADEEVKEAAAEDPNKAVFNDSPENKAADAFVSGVTYNAKLKTEIDKMTSYTDISSLNIISKPEKEQQDDLIHAISQSSPSFGVPCIASGYSAQMASLSYGDVLSLLSTDGQPAYDSRHALYSIVYSKIKEFSPVEWKKSRPTFEQWTQMTAFCDLETLLYGIYHCTYQDKSIIQFTCPHCGEKVSETIVNSTIARTEDDKNLSVMAKRVETQGTSVAGVLTCSKVIVDPKEPNRNITGVRLPRSGFIFGLKLPTIADQLDFIRSYQDTTAGMAPDLILAYQMTSVIYLPSVTSLTGKNDYTAIKTKKDIMNVITALTIDDVLVLTKAVQKIYRQWNISYGAKNIKCDHCGKNIEFIPMVMEDLLFTPVYASQLA